MTLPPPPAPGAAPRGEAPPADDVLVGRARGGDRRAAHALVERYEGRVAATVVGMLGPGPEAEDVGQEVFVRFFGALDHFRGDAAVGTYLTRIAINQSLKALKKRQGFLRRFVRPADPNTFDAPDPDATPDHTLDARERAALVHRALDRLSPAHRAVVVLRMLDGQSTRETAAALGVPEGTVMSRLARALHELEGPLSLLR
ncbi:MAG TPA: RNA polymerase sigma factor [Rhodothermales bacterium]|nr:RNA polymerase sigma factor [Rhodothermales bacterium]